MKVILDQYDVKDILKFIRQSTGLTQKQYGEIIGKSKESIKSYELGRSKMSFNDFIYVCKLFNIKVIIEKKDEFIMN